MRAVSGGSPYRACSTVSLSCSMAVERRSMPSASGSAACHRLSWRPAAASSSAADSGWRRCQARSAACMALSVTAAATAPGFGASTEVRCGAAAGSGCSLNRCTLPVLRSSSRNVPCAPPAVRLNACGSRCRGCVCSRRSAQRGMPRRSMLHTARCEPIRNCPPAVTASACTPPSSSAGSIGVTARTWRRPLPAVAANARIRRSRGSNIHTVPPPSAALADGTAAPSGRRTERASSAPEARMISAPGACHAAVPSAATASRLPAGGTPARVPENRPSGASGRAPTWSGAVTTGSPLQGSSSTRPS